MANEKTLRHKSTKTNGPTLKTLAEVEHCVGEIARLTIERDAALAEMDGRVQEIRKDYEQLLSDLGADIEAEMALAQQWAEASPSEFKERKSLMLTHGQIGFRTGTPKLKTLKGFTWDRVLERLRSVMPEFIRRKEEPDKERLLADRATLDLGSIGVQVVQEETFFVEVKREEAAGVQI